MNKMMSSLLVSIFALGFFSMKPIELDAPLPKETGAWQHIPGDISLFVDEECCNESLCFVAEGQGPNPSVILSLDTPGNQSEVKAFLKQCKSYLDSKSYRRGALVAMGRTLADQAQHWVSENVAHSEETTPDLNGVLFGTPSLQVVQQSDAKDSSVQVTYGFSLPKMQTSRDLRKFWSLALVQQMTKDRLKAQKISCETESSSQFLLPEKKVAYRMAFKESDKDFKRFLHGMQEIKQVGFTIEELTEAKRSFAENLHKLQDTQPTKGVSNVASFHAEGFLRNLGLLSYAYFLDSASALIDSITPVDVAIALNECYADDKRHVLLFANASKSDSMETLVRKDLDESGELRIQHTSDVIVATEANPPGSDAFFQLTLTDADKEMIYKIIDTMARDNVIKLGLKRKTMERKGKKIRHVHPLRFLGCIFADNHLHSCMREVSRSMFKWNGFVDGLKDRLREEGARGNLYQYVPAFAQYVNRDPKKVTHYLEKHDWDGLVRYLL